MNSEQRFKIKQIYRYASDHFRSWFSQFSSYEVFDVRFNLFGEAFKWLSTYLISLFVPFDCIKDLSLLDAMPIITCSGKLEGKMAREITDKCFCSAKGIYYYGLRLNILMFNHPHHLRFPEQSQLTLTSENKLYLFKQA
ncbi:MAG: hypothetical protein WCM93_15405 [Bacteroidota bacterium]